jgi:hypothetical protein
MSGGHFQYKQYDFTNIADEIRRLIETNDCQELDRYGCRIGRGYGPDVIAKFCEAEMTCRMAGAMAHRVDWLVSDDDGPDNFLERWDEELAKLDVEEVELKKRC